MTNLDTHMRLAAALADGSLAEQALESNLLDIPPLDRDGLDNLFRLGEQASLKRPRLGYAIAAVADAAARRLASSKNAADPDTPNLFMQALTAWRLAYAANQWVRPERVQAALARARQDFAALGETGWLAACDWQVHALPWLSNDVAESTRILAAALDGLAAAGLDDFVPHCRLSLAYAQLLMGEFSASMENIAASEAVYTARADRLNQARCWQYRASALRRQGKNDQAGDAVHAALQAFDQLGAEVDRARAQYVLAYSYYFASGDWEATEALFDEAAHAFHDQDLPLWEGPSLQGLAHVYLVSGRLHEARSALKQAREICSAYPETAVYADCLVDSGHLEMFWGRPEQSLSLLEQAVHTYTAFGSPRLAAIAAMYLGLACIQFNQYQRALHHLEAAQTVFQFYEAGYRLAECRLHQALAWSRLGHLQQAESMLAGAMDHYRSSSRNDQLAAAYLQQAELHYRSGRASEAIAPLQEALRLAQDLGERHLVANIQWLLGETHLALQQTSEAYAFLQASAAEYEAILMPLGAAAAQVTLGELYAQTARSEQARKSWRKSLRLSAQAAPDIAWRAEAGLARLAEGALRPEQALAAYRRMAASLGRVRRDFRQPALAGSYLRQPASALDAAVSLAARLGAAEDALSFIEESKAQTLAVKFLDPGGSGLSDAAPLEDLTAEIRWLQESLRAAGQAQTGRLRTPQQAQWLLQLRDRQRQYDEVLSRLERSRLSGEAVDAILPYAGFDLSRFRTLANRNLDDGWMAVDYYLGQDFLAVIALTARDLHVWQQPVDERFHQALAVCSRAVSGPPRPGRAELAVLGDRLLPAELRQRMTADGILLIAPHRRLHQVPWAAITDAAGQASLAECCIPVIVPSLSIQALLWSRAAPPSLSRQTGLVLAVSDFAGLRPPLPEARREADWLGQSMDQDSVALLEGQASWQNLQDLAKSRGLDHFAFWHVASHAFHDPYTGRLSGVALTSGDLWLDRIAELAPLPALVTLSACSGMQSVVYEGDEPISLSAACLAAGARQVVASLWPVRDDLAAPLMTSFYQHWWSGVSAPRALIFAQRDTLRAAVDQPDSAPGDALDGWGSFLCAGA